MAHYALTACYGHFMPQVPEVADKEYLSVSDVLKAVHISRRTLERYIASGDIPVAYLPSGHRRFLRSDVLALLTPSTPITPAADLSPRTSAVGASSVSVPGAPEAPGPDPFREAS